MHWAFSIFAERDWSGQIYLLIYQVISQGKNNSSDRWHDAFSLRISNILRNEVLLFYVMFLEVQKNGNLEKSNHVMI